MLKTDLLAFIVWNEVSVLFCFPSSTDSSHNSKRFLGMPFSCKHTNTAFLQCSHECSYRGKPLKNRIFDTFWHDTTLICRTHPSCDIQLIMFVACPTLNRTSRRANSFLECQIYLVKNSERRELMRSICWLRNAKLGHLALVFCMAHCLKNYIFIRFWYQSNILAPWAFTQNFSSVALLSTELWARKNRKL